MRNFKKALVKTLLFVLVFSLLCTPSLFLYFKFGSENNNILPELDAETGKIDVVICGASQAVWAVIPNLLDEKCGCNSFNISSGLLSMEGRYEILSRVLAENPVDKLVLDFSFNGLERDNETDTAEGEILLAEHLHGMQRLRYTVTHIKLDEVFSSFYYMFRTGTYSLLTRSFLRTNDSPLFGKGYWTTSNVSDQSGIIRWDKNKLPEKRTYTASEDSLLYLDKIMQLCSEKQIEVIFLTTPYPTRAVSWSDRDGMLDVHLSLAQKYGCTLYDLNLHKEKDAIFDNKTAYYDEEHLSMDGAVKCTELLASLINAGDAGVGQSDSFFPTYHDYILNFLAENPV